MKNHFTVVIADDEKNIREGLSSMKVWKELGIEIVGVAAAGDEAYEQIRGNHPDFAVMDIKMPGISGLDVLAMLKKEKIDTDVIILSGYSDFDLAQNAIRNQARGYLLKPVDEAELKEMLISLAEARQEKEKDKEIDLKLTREMLNNLVTGSLVDTSTVARLIAREKGGISDTDCYAAVAFLGKRAGGESDRKITLLLKEKLSALRYIMWYMESDTIVFIFNTSASDPFTVSTMIIECLDACGYCNSIVTSGSVVNGLQQIAYSYTRALSAETYRFYYESARIFSSDMIPEKAPDVKPGDIDTDRLENAVINADKMAIAEEAERIVNLLTVKPYPPKNYVCSMLYSVIKAVESDFEPLLEDTQVERAADDLASSATLGEIRNKFRDIFIRMSNFIDSVYGQERASLLLRGCGVNDDEIIKTACNYIQQHIHEQILIEDIAGEVNLSPTYFAIYFRKNTGEKLRNYILSKKMEWAKKELMKKNASVNNIAFSLGYNDYRSFSRAFKNVTGMTPSEFMGKEQ